MSQPSIQHFSTRAVPEGMRFDYWMSILRQSLWPVSDWTGLPQDFDFELREASLGAVTTMAETISPHRSHRTRSDVSRSGDRCYLLFANQLPWSVAHNGHSERYLSGDIALIDSEGELETSAESGFSGVILKLPVKWIRSWLADPKTLVGRPIAVDSKWGRILSPIVSQITHELATAPPLPHGVQVDQIGVTLALIAGESESRNTPDLLKKIQDCIRQRSSEPQLTATDVAATLEISPRNLHRVLVASMTTFASQLLDARITAAQHMLTSRSFDWLAVNQIGHRAGFLSTSHFVRVMRKRTAHTPVQLRRLSLGALQK